MYKRVLPFALAGLLLLAAGCGKAPVQDKAEEIAPEPVVITGEADETSAADVAHSSLYSVDGTAEESGGEAYASDTANVNTVLVENAGVLTMTGTDINKTGDSAGDVSGGQNAALAVLTGGAATLNGSNITTNARGAFGLFVSGEGSAATLSGTSVYTSGESSPALVVLEGGVAIITGGTLSAEGEDSACILLSGGRLTLSGVSLSAAGGEILRVLAGTSELTLDNTTVSAMPALEDGALLLLRLQNGASFRGELGGSVPAKASVTLDAASKLILTQETYVAGFVNADLTHANIQSNGFNLYYDSSAAENAYLEGQSFLLPGGGFLAPII